MLLGLTKLKQDEVPVAFVLVCDVIVIGFHSRAEFMSPSLPLVIYTIISTIILI